MADSVSDKAHLRVVTARTLHAHYRMQERKQREQGSDTVWFKFQREVCLCVCVCVCVRSGDMSGIESKINVLFLVKPATGMWLVACSGRYLHRARRLVRRPAANQRPGMPAVWGAARCASLPKQSDVGNSG